MNRTVRISLSILSGLLIVLSMPNYNQWYLAWIALVPLFVAFEGLEYKERKWLALITTLIWSIGVHNWYPVYMGMWLGLFLILLVAFLFAEILSLGKSLEDRVPLRYKIFMIPIIWTAFEWLRFVAPITKDWWFVLVSKSQWNNPVTLQPLALGGFALLTFLILLVNSSFALLVSHYLKTRKLQPPYLIGLFLPIVMIGISFFNQASSNEVVKVAAISDMISQNEEITKLASSEKAGDGYVADSEEMMQAIFEVNETLTREVVKEHKPQFVVWSENEFTNSDHPAMLQQAKDLAKELNIYLVVDFVWNSDTGMHDTAMLIGPDGEEVGRRAKLQMTSGELDYGFTAGPETFEIFETKYGNVGLAICWDKHRNDIIRKLVRNGADLLLIPDDNDFEGNERFPLYASTDSIFRAVENGTALSSASVSGNSMVIQPSGKIAAMTTVNQQEAAVGEVMINKKSTLYTPFGDWFGIFVTALSVISLILGFPKRSMSAPKPHNTNKQIS
ncbi:nitrilase-related carbon-nitrogen hydrolase [Bacillus tianshenii]|nr:nitrilase-related carbon-nitrogen hydrolase [Bacillus tianshenii]